MATWSHDVVSRSTHPRWIRPLLTDAETAEESCSWFTAAFGCTERDGTRPVSTDTIFSLQWASKMYTATAAMCAYVTASLGSTRP